MTDQKLNAAVAKEPFEPVQLMLTNGATYNITHPDAIMVRKRMAAVAVGDVIHVISNLHVNQVIPLGSVRP